MIKRQELKEDVERIGEMHVSVEERNAQLEVRVGQAEFEEDVLIVETKQDKVKVPYDSITDWDEPQQIWDME